MTNPFKKAERQAVPLKIAFTGPSGSCKTYSSLLLARGIVGEEGKIAVIDTENGSASLYADLTDFDVLNISPPFTTEKYEEAIQAATDGAYDIIIIDGISHAWAHSGGLLEQKDDLDLTSKNQFGNWGPIGRKHNSFLSSMLQSPLDVIVTMRSKHAYEQKGGKVIKLGLAPVQRDGVEYEFMVVFDGQSKSHLVIADIDRTGLFSKRGPFLIEGKDGILLREWRDKGNDFIAPLSTNTKAALMVKFKELGLTKDTWVALLATSLTDLGITEITKLDELSDEQGVSLYKTLTKENE